MKYMATDDDIAPSNIMPYAHKKKRTINTNRIFFIPMVLSENPTMLLAIFLNYPCKYMDMTNI